MIDDYGRRMCWYSDHAGFVNAGWRRQAESSELADGVQAQTRAIGKLAFAAATHCFNAVGAMVPAL
jgi:hypothetical protein